MSKPRGLFDEQFSWWEKLSKQKYPLGKLSSYIDFEYFHKPMKQSFDKDRAHIRIHDQQHE